MGETDGGNWRGVVWSAYKTYVEPAIGDKADEGDEGYQGRCTKGEDEGDVRCGKETLISIISSFISS